MGCIYISIFIFRNRMHVYEQLLAHKEEKRNNGDAYHDYDYNVITL